MSGYGERQQRLWWLLLAFAVLLIGAGIGLRDPWPADEPRFALIAREMVATGQWLFLRSGATGTSGARQDVRPSRSRSSSSSR